ncbi:dirigent protein 1-like [Panicum miliaceum]|uniref:Dirigent protein n=1 Tax=Panicum miliaceum TaxID=4540 RepID=A0A3L6QVZ0_PANMI|nr:dirigent protein 1-like [Panicum miliaceum]
MASSPSLLVLAAVLALFSPAALAAGREERARIRVYVRERFSGPNATVGSVAPSLLGDNSTFGEVGVVDDVLRAGPDPSSREVGRYQGLFAGADLADANYLSAITLVFTAGEHRGSTLSLQGSYTFPGDEVLERAVVGGTGGFRMARGVSLLKVVSAPPEAAVFQLDLVVFTPRRRY